ncbi:MAG: nucleotidyltransferase family protein [Chloroflexota bacterium]
MTQPPIHKGGCVMLGPPAAPSAYDSVKNSVPVCFMHPVISDQLAAIADLCRKYRVKRMDVFGSAARGAGFDLERSDVDFILDVDPGSGPFTITSYLALQSELEALLGRDVDLTLEGTVRNPYVKRTIEWYRENVFVA